MVVNYVDPDPDDPQSKPKRRFDCYKEESSAIAAAEESARRIDAFDYVAASMSREQAIEYADASAALKPFGVTVRVATSTVAHCLKVSGDLDALRNAVKLYAVRHKQTVRKPVAEVVREFLTIKRVRGASQRWAR